MVSIVKIAKTLRNHWKKSTFAALVLAYGLNYAKTKYEFQQIMRAYCKEAKVYGDVPIGNIVKPRHVTVIMNPAAKNSKGMALYEKYAMPLLNLAGIRVSLIKTEYEGQAKALMEVMDNTDAVLVAGGDGTFSEVVTGLCKREDANIAINKLPLGIIPIGKTNTVAKYLFWNSSQNECRLLAETAMAVIKGNLKPIDVMSVTGDDGKQVYALSSLEYGRLRDVKERIPKYWYWGYLQTKMAYVFASYKKQCEPLEGSLAYTLPCEGCSKCHNKYILNGSANQDKPETRRWWHSFLPKQNNLYLQPKIVRKDYSKVINESCGVWHDRTLNTIDLSIETSNNRPLTDSLVPSLTVNIGPQTLGRLELIKRGWQIDHSNYSVSKNNNEDIEVIHANEVKLQINFPENVESWYSIDSENFEAKSVKTELFPKKINVFCK